MKLQKINAMVFWYFKKLTEVTIPDSVTSIEMNPFIGCEKLTEVIFLSQTESKLTTIGANAFANCISLVSITIPNNVKIYKILSIFWVYIIKNNKDNDSVKI